MSDEKSESEMTVKETEVTTATVRDDATGEPLAGPVADHPENATQVRTNNDGSRTGSV
jgi:hypothetical protein